MRTPVSLGLLALSLGFSASSAFAGNEEACDVLVGGTPSLYGLCIAYANAGNENARDRIASNYAKKMQPGDPDLASLFDDGPTCPCWDETILLTDACAYEVTQNLGTVVILGGNTVQYFNFGSSCGYSNFGPGGISIGMPYTEDGQAEACQAGIDMLVSGELLEFCEP